MVEYKHKVLIVDDEPTLLKMLGKSLSNQLQCELILTSSPKEAVELLKQETVSVLMCDLIMPVISGIDVIKTAHEANPNTVSIMLTGKASTQPIIQALNEGGLWRCIEKPCRPQELVDTVRAGIEQYDLRFHGQSAKAAQAAQRELLEKRVPGRNGNGLPPKKKVVLSSGKKKMQIKARRKITLKPKGYRDENAQRKLREIDPVQLVDKRYQIDRLIKEGGFSAVYKAEDTLLNMPVAIKILLPGFLKDEGSAETLFEEARITMKLSHNNIVRLHNLQESNGIYYLVMEYIDGITFRDVLVQNGPLAYENVLQLADICADALEYAHGMNILHHDLKPENIMLDVNGTVKIIDMGMACLADVAMAGDEICGTPYYMSPEEIRGDELDTRSDVYSMAVVLHELLTGQLPVQATAEGNFLQLTASISTALPREVRRVFETGIAEHPEDRWASMKVMAQALREAESAMLAGSTA